MDRSKFKLFANELLNQGVFMSPANTLHSLSCIAHDEADIQFTANAVARTLDKL